jgi:class 3 adenylate cyclase
MAFIDIVHFTSLVARLDTLQVVQLLNHVFSVFDAMTDEFGMCVFVCCWRRLPPFAFACAILLEFCVDGGVASTVLRVRMRMPAYAAGSG